ncbi:MAG: response regulator [Bacteroidales bacterium]|nr:response regulator [Bacteroidales bacterium]
MRTAIIDDETKSRQTLLNFTKKYAPELIIIGEADCVEKGILLIETEKPDLVFLDIQMPDGTGFDLLGRVMYNDFKLIFCTSFDQYAVKAFRFSAIDYLLKPLDPDIFMAAVNKISQEDKSIIKDKLEVLHANKSNFLRIALHSADGINIVNINDIIRCESNGNYTKFIIENQSNLLITKTLKDFDGILSNHGFIRIHKSFLANLNHITKYVKGEAGWIIMSDDAKIIVSRRKKDQLLKALSNI